MSNLSIGLVTSPSEESKQLISLLENLGVIVSYHISPEEIQSHHIEDEVLNVWLLNVDDDHWHDNIDQLLDESEASIYFNEPGTLAKQSHPEYWSEKLVTRLYELTGLVSDDVSNDPQEEVQSELPQSEPQQSEPQRSESLRSEAPQKMGAVVEPPVEQPVSLTEEVGQSIEKSSSKNEIESADNLSSALDELETNSIGLPSEIAAELVSELEDISPDLDISLDESFSLDDDLSIEQEENSEQLSVDQPSTSVEEESQAERDMQGSVLLDSDILLESDDSIELEVDSIAIDTELDLVTDTDTSETSQIADEILQLAEQPVGGSENSNDSFDEIDFSNSSIPMLESARDDDQKVLESIYDLEEPSQDAARSDSIEVDSIEEDSIEEDLLDPELAIDENDLNQSVKDALALEDSTELEESLEDVSDELELMSGELSLDIDDNEKIDSTDTPVGRANFLTDEDDEQAPSNERPTEINEQDDSLSELSLEMQESSESMPVTGKAVFIDEQELIDDREQAGQQELAETANESDNFESLEQAEELSLESIEQTSITGKAVFIEEQVEVVEKTEIVEPELDDGGLTLESDGGSPVTGKAEFVIDGEPQHATQEKAEPKTDEAQQDTIETIESASAGLELSPTGEPEQNDWLNPEESEQLVESAEEELELEFDEQSLSLDETEVTDAEQLTFESEPIITEQVSEAGEKGNLSESTETLEFEIPMLEESATGLDLVEVAPQQSNDEEKIPCWVIGASLGGPAAVKRFLQSLPADINASFIVVQHIDESFLPVLADILTSNSHFDVKVANGSNPMLAGKIYLAPLKGKLIFLQDGSMLVDHSQKWSGPYSPCIDDVMISLSAVYGEKSGAIIFSGMGQDGLKGSEKMLAAGGCVWAQSMDTCANASMPEAVINASLASVVAPPEILADRLAEHLKEFNENQRKQV